MPTFDISSEYNQQEVVNAVDQAHREISNRYDFRDTRTFISYSENTITIKSSTPERMAAAEQVLKEINVPVSLKSYLFEISLCVWSTAFDTSCGSNSEVISNVGIFKY